MTRKLRRRDLSIGRWNRDHVADDKETGKNVAFLKDMGNGKSKPESFELEDPGIIANFVLFISAPVPEDSVVQLLWR